MKIVVVTGCLGFIGQYITRACLEKGWVVYGYDKLTYVADRAALEHMECYSTFKFEKRDICELRRLPDCDYVINVAAESHVGNSIVENQTFVQSNVEGVRNLLELIRNKPKNAYGQPKLIHFSTDEVYGDTESGSFAENSSLNPSNPYSASKAAADMLIKAWARTYGVRYNIVRPTNNYGLRQFPEKLIPLCVKAMESKKRIVLHNMGEPVRSWLHVEDTAEAVMTVVENAPDNEIYNIGGEEHKNKDVVKACLKAYYPAWDYSNFDDFVDYSYVREGQDVRYSVSDEKLRALGWKPKHKLMDTIPELVDDMRTNFRW